MKSNMRWIAALVSLTAVIALLMVASGPALGQVVDNPDSPAIPPEIDEHQDEWPLMNHDYSNTRSADSSITSENVDQLGLAWAFDIPGRSSYGAAASNPLIIDGVVYFQDLASNVFAIDFQTGDVLWEHIYEAPTVGPNGPAVGWDKVFVGVGGESIAALDKMTGNEVWSVKLVTKPSEGIDIQPMIYDGLVYVSTVPGRNVQNFYAGGVAGIVYALDQETGDVVWAWSTVAGDDLWGNPEVNSGGGWWYPPAVDLDTGVLYGAVANPAPWPGTEQFPNGSSRPGPNLFSNSMVALDHDTGELLWYTQVLPHDLFDLDFMLSPILTRALFLNEQRDMVIGGGKLGEIFAFDQATGEIFWRAVVGEHLNTRLQEVPRDTVVKVLPGALGGVETPFALSPDGVLYAPIVNLPAYYSPTEYLSERVSFAEGTGELTAIDAGTGAILWSHVFEAMNFGGATVVNDLVFTATYNGTIYAFERETGEIVWTYQAPAGINAWPAVVGDTIVWPAGVGENAQLIALRLGAGGPEATAEATPEATPTEEGEMEGRPTATPTGEAEAEPTPTPDAEATPEDGGDTAGLPDPQSVGNPQEGRQLFMNMPVNAQACANCHSVGPGGEGGVGPSLADIAQVAQGRVEGMDAVAYLHESIVEPNAFVVPGYPSGVMPQDYEQALSEQQIDNIIAYLLTLGRGDQGP